jgi:hypothetical protein
MSKKHSSYYDEPAPEVTEVAAAEAPEQQPKPVDPPPEGESDKAAEIKKLAKACHDEMFGYSADEAEADLSPYETPARLYWAMTHPDSYKPPETEPVSEPVPAAA